MKKKITILMFLALSICYIFPYFPLWAYYIVKKDVNFFDTDTRLPVEVKGVEYYSGKFPTYIDVVDINGDGVSEVVTTAVNDNSIRIFSINTDMEFELTQSIHQNVYKPRLSTFADLNNDGFQDLIVPNWGEQESTVSIFKNLNGKMLFEKYISVGLRPRRVFSGDLNNDGFIDLIVANNFSDSISILKNSGNNYDIETVQTINTDEQPGSLVINDLDGDGINEIIATFRVSNLVNVYKSSGDFDYSLSQSLKVKKSPKEEVVLDFNKDSAMDIAVISGDGRTLQLFENVKGVLMPVSEIATVGLPHSVKLFKGENNGQQLITAEFPNWLVHYDVSVEGNMTIINKYWIGGVDVSGSLYVNVIDTNEDGIDEVLITKSNKDKFEHIQIVKPLITK
jgi:hypothetical protein